MTARRASRGSASGPEGPDSFEIAGERIPPGERRDLEIPVARSFAPSWIHLPVWVLHGMEQPGPRLWVSAAVHGDELNGVEIVRRLVGKVSARRLRGTLIAVPIVNVFGFLQQSRYLPDHRDLNRAFPGGPRGSLASRLAHLFMTEIVARATLGIDLHTASQQRTNLPQIRADLRDPETLRCARAFGAPFLLDARGRKGSLRTAAGRRGVSTLVYEAGENLRLNQGAIRTGVRGLLQVMASLGMIAERTGSRQVTRVEASRASWVRARRSGMVRLSVKLGARVDAGQQIGVVTDVLSGHLMKVRTPIGGLVIGRTNNPLVNLGDGILHVAEVG